MNFADGAYQKFSRLIYHLKRARLKHDGLFLMQALRDGAQLPFITPIRESERKPFFPNGLALLENGQGVERR